MCVNHKDSVPQRYCLVYVLIYLLVGSLTVSFSLLNYIRLGPFTTMFLQQVQLLQNEVIADIQIVQEYAQCPAGFDDALFSFKWGGTVDGCRCDDGKVLRGRCARASGARRRALAVSERQSTHSLSASLSSASCSGTTINSLDEASFGTLPVASAANATLYRAKVCARRVSGYSFLLRPPLQAGLCYAGERWCGRDVYGFCVPASEKCPITLLTFQPQTAWSAHEEQLSAFPSLPAYVYRETNHTPLSEMTASAGGGVCVNREQTDSDASLVGSPLERQETCDSVDDRFVSFGDSVQRLALFQANGLYYDLLSRLPSYSMSTASAYALYLRGYTAIDFRCRQAVLDYFGSRNSSDELELYARLSLAQIVLCCLYAGFIVFLESVFVWRMTRTRGREAKLRRRNWFCLKQLVFATLFFFVCACLHQTYALRSFLSYLTTHSCVSGTALSVLNDLLSYVRYGSQDVIFAALLFYWLTDWQLWSALLQQCLKKRVIVPQTAQNLETALGEPPSLQLADTQRANLELASLYPVNQHLANIPVRRYSTVDFGLNKRRKYLAEIGISPED